MGIGTTRGFSLPELSVHQFLQCNIPFCRISASVLQICFPFDSIQKLHGSIICASTDTRSSCGSWGSWEWCEMRQSVCMRSLTVCPQTVDILFCDTMTWYASIQAELFLKTCVIRRAILTTLLLIRLTSANRTCLPPSLRSIAFLPSSPTAPQFPMLRL